jgi:hypothetical protein
VRVISDPGRCGYNQRLEKFVIPTREDNVRLSYGGPAFGQYQNGVYLKTADVRYVHVVHGVNDTPD